MHVPVIAMTGHQWTARSVECDEDDKSKISSRCERARWTSSAGQWCLPGYEQFLTTAEYHSGGEYPYQPGWSSQVAVCMVPSQITSDLSALSFSPWERHQSSMSAVQSTIVRFSAWISVTSNYVYWAVSHQQIHGTIFRVGWRLPATQRHAMNLRGPSDEPWGSPQSRSVTLDSTPPVTTHGCIWTRIRFCTRKSVHLYSVMSLGKMIFAVLELRMSPLQWVLNW